jgi:hypothetical protein
LNEALIIPAGTVTEMGTVKDVLVDRNNIETAAVEAAVSDTVHVPPAPGVTSTGAQVNCESEEAAVESTITNVTAAPSLEARSVTF